MPLVLADGKSDFRRLGQVKCPRVCHRENFCRSPDDSTSSRRRRSLMSPQKLSGTQEASSRPWPVPSLDVGHGMGNLPKVKWSQNSFAKVALLDLFGSGLCLEFSFDPWHQRERHGSRIPMRSWTPDRSDSCHAEFLRDRHCEALELFIHALTHSLTTHSLTEAAHEHRVKSHYQPCRKGGHVQGMAQGKGRGSMVRPFQGLPNSRSPFKGLCETLAGLLYGWCLTGLRPLSE